MLKAKWEYSNKSGNVWLFIPAGYEIYVSLYIYGLGFVRQGTIVKKCKTRAEAQHIWFEV